MKSLRAALAGLIALGLLIIPATSANASNSWGNYHWARTANPFTISTVKSLTPDWVGRTDAALADWSKSTVLDLAGVAGASDSQTRRKCPAISGKIRVCNQTYGLNGWLGLASIHISGSHIVDGTTKLNDSYFNLASYNYETEKRHVVCQEVGHDIGLDHTSTDGSSQNTCMDYYQNKSNSDTTSTTPNQHDYDQLAAMYSHLDSSSTVSSASASSASESWDAGRGVTIINTVDANGNGYITRIIWATDLLGAGRITQS